MVTTRRTALKRSRGPQAVARRRPQRANRGVGKQRRSVRLSHATCRQPRSGRNSTRPSTISIGAGVAGATARPQLAA